MSNKYIKSLQEVDSINILEFNIEKKNWIYIGNYNIVIEKTELLGSVLNLIKEGMCEKDIIDKLKSKFQEGEVNEQLNVLIKTFQEDNIRKEKSKKIFKVTQDSWENGNAVVGLFLNVSNDCNLRCTYCYGDGGNYGSDRTLMTQDTAKKNIDYWFKH